jgi:hypothetical protein
LLQFQFCFFDSLDFRSVENIITNYPPDSLFINLIRIVMSLAIVGSFPMSSYPLRHTVNMLLMKCRRGYKDPNPPVGWKMNIVIIFILLVTALCLAIFFPHIVAIFGLLGTENSKVFTFVSKDLQKVILSKYMYVIFLGSTSLTLLAYMLPSFMYIKLRRSYRAKRYCSRGNILPFLMGVVGFCFGVASTVIILRSLSISNNSLE